MTSSQKTTTTTPVSSSQAKRVYVGNLAWSVRSQELQDFFQEQIPNHTVVSANVFMMRNHYGGGGGGGDGGGRSKGCGVVEFTSVEGAQQAILTCNDIEWQGRPIWVREDREVAAPPSTSTATTPTTASKPKPKSTTTTSTRTSKPTTTTTATTTAWKKQGQSSAPSTTTASTAKTATEATNTSTTNAPNNSSGKRVYVGNLAWSVTWDMLKDHMKGGGEYTSSTLNVVYANIMSEPNGRSKGCGIVEYASPEEAQQAIQELSETELEGRNIFVREDREAPQGGGGGGGGSSGGFGGGSGGGGRRRFGGNGNTGDGGGGGGRPYQNRTASGLQIFVANLPFETTWHELKEFVLSLPAMQDLSVDRVDARRGYGTIKFKSAKDAETAITKLNGTELHGRTLQVRMDQRG